MLSTAEIAEKSWNTFGEVILADSEEEMADWQMPMRRSTWKSI